MSAVSERLEYLRGELRGECISMGELVELQGLADFIDPGDVELLEAAGVPECAPGEALMSVSDLQEGDRVDLEGDEYAAHCEAEGCEACEASRMFYECEYAVVAGVELETPTCLRVDFESSDSIGFPPTHRVRRLV